MNEKKATVLSDDRGSSSSPNPSSESQTENQTLFYKTDAKQDKQHSGKVLPFRKLMVLLGV